MMSLTIKQIEDALTRHGGFVSQAAKALNVQPQAIYKRIRRSQHLTDVQFQLTETYLDLAESKLIKAIQEGESWAICFFLKCRGKQRGYVEKQMLDHTSSDKSMSPKKFEDFYTNKNNE